MRTAVIIAECTHVAPGCTIRKVGSNSHTLAVYPSSLLLLNTHVDQMQTVREEENHTQGSDLLVSRTLGWESGAVYLAASTRVTCSVWISASLHPCLGSREERGSLAKYLRQQHEWWAPKSSKHQGSRMKFSALHHLLALFIMLSWPQKQHLKN